MASEHAAVHSRMDVMTENDRSVPNHNTVFELFGIVLTGGPVVESMQDHDSQWVVLSAPMRERGWVQGGPSGWRQSAQVQILLICFVQNVRQGTLCCILLVL
jgi:hypothetical protein